VAAQPLDAVGAAATGRALASKLVAHAFVVQEILTEEVGAHRGVYVAAGIAPM